jgi:pyruvate dehydrogenase complex dehydrogenase (E1) component
MTAIMSALYFHALRPQDKVAVKPHAGPVLHALHYLLGNQSLEQLQTFRGLGGAQSYPSRTKDKVPVDFSTGSVGLGVAITAFASLVQDYLIAHGQLPEGEAGRMIALMGDAELDEGNIYECLIEGYKHDIRNCWWIVDYNRQSLDSTTADRMFRRFDDIFETCGWRVITIKHGKLQREVFKWRLENEYNVELRLDRKPWTRARWVLNVTDEVLEILPMVVKDEAGRFVALFHSDFEIDYAKSRYKGLELLEHPPSEEEG